MQVEGASAEPIREAGALDGDEPKSAQKRHRRGKRGARKKKSEKPYAELSWQEKQRMEEIARQQSLNPEPRAPKIPVDGKNRIRAGVIARDFRPVRRGRVLSVRDRAPKCGVLHNPNKHAAVLVSRPNHQHRCTPTDCHPPPFFCQLLNPLTIPRFRPPPPPPLTCSRRRATPPTLSPTSTAVR